MTIPTISKNLVPYSDTAIAPRGRMWNASAALTRFRKWASAPDKEKDSLLPMKYRSMFVRYDADNTEDRSSYDGPHHDIIDGDPHTVFRGVAAIAVVAIASEIATAEWLEDIAGIKAHTEKHYEQFDEQAPWQRDEKDFDWLPEEKRAAKAFGLDLTEMQQALFAPEGAGVANKGCPCKDGSKAMPEKVLIIRADADVSEEIETPADGVFDKDVVAVSRDNGEIWLELDDGRIKDDDPADGDPDPDPADGDGDPADGDPADGDGDPAYDDNGDPVGDGDDDQTYDDNGDPVGDGDGDPADGDPDGKGSQPDQVLDYSLLGELAETGYMRYLWNLTYALSDVLIDLIGADDLSVDEKVAKSDKALVEFVGLAKSSFAEAVTIAADDDPDDEDPFAGMSFADVVRAALSEADGLDLSDASGEDVNEIAAEVAELQTKLTEAVEQGGLRQDQLEESKRLIDELLDMPLERKTDGDPNEDAVTISEKYPWLDSSVRRKLAAAKVK